MSARARDPEPRVASLIKWKIGRPLGESCAAATDDDDGGAAHEPVGDVLIMAADQRAPRQAGRVAWG